METKWNWEFLSALTMRSIIYRDDYLRIQTTENRMKKWTKQKIFTYGALFFLLVVRCPIGDFASNLSRFLNIPVFSSWLDTLRAIQNSTFYLWKSFSFILVGIVILVNRNDLKKININRIFLYLFAINGILFCRYYFWPAGWMGIVISGCITYMLLKNKFNFENNSRPNSRGIIIVLVIAYLLYWLVKIELLNIPSIVKYTHYFLTLSPSWLVEEVIFRGLLWMCLEELGWSEFVIIIVQAWLFWLFHIYYMFSNPILFWLEIPLLNILLGILVRKYKSITPSSVAHILFNLR
jgi:hypothetical protein